MLPLILSGKTYGKLAPKMMQNFHADCPLKSFWRNIRMKCRRSETACSNRKGTDHRTEDHAGGRTDRGTGPPERRQVWDGFGLSPSIRRTDHLMVTHSIQAGAMHPGFCLSKMARYIIRSTRGMSGQREMLQRFPIH